MSEPLLYDSDAIQAGVGPRDHLYPEAASLAGWLSTWLDGIDLWAAPKQEGWRKDNELQ